MGWTNNEVRNPLQALFTCLEKGFQTKNMTCLRDGVAILIKPCFIGIHVHQTSTRPQQHENHKSSALKIGGFQQKTELFDVRKMPTQNLENLENHPVSLRMSSASWLRVSEAFGSCGGWGPSGGLHCIHGRSIKKPSLSGALRECIRIQKAILMGLLSHS
jgi:hypothetical protein